MGSIIAVASQKGGVGKTTTALNLGYALSRIRPGVLIVDADPQASLAIATNQKRKSGRGLLHVLEGQCAPSDVVVPTRDGAMAIVSVGSLAPDETMRFEEHARNGGLGALLRTLSEGYAYTIIDAPSGVGGLATALLSVSDSVILPMQPRALSLRTLPAFLRTIQFIRKQHNPRLRIEGVVITMFNAQSASDGEALEEVRRSFPDDIFFHAIIPSHELFEEATLKSVPVFMLPGGQRVARSYIELALEVQDRNQMRETGDGEVAGLF